MGRIARVLFSFNGQHRKFVRSLASFQDGMRRRLEEIGDSFVLGYHAALEDDGPESLAGRLAEVEAEPRGFAYEGAGLGLALLDALTPWRRHRLSRFLDGPGDHQAYMLHIGAGWVLARTPVSRRRFLAQLDPLLRWLALDGFGFHEAFFRWRRTVEGQHVPVWARGYATRPFDVGVGRRLWFTPEPEVAHIPRLIAAFPAGRQGDLWTGVGEACAFAGGRDPHAVAEIQRAAGPFTPQLGQGAAFSAQARIRGSHPAAHTELACRVLCGMTTGEAAALTDSALAGLPADGEVPAFEVWRRRIQERLQ